MSTKTLICTLILSAMSTQADQLTLSGYEISFSDGCSIALSTNGTIRAVILPAGDIQRDSSQQPKDAGATEIKDDSAGKINSVGGADIKRDPEGKIKSVGRADIKRDLEGKLKSVGGVEIKRDSVGNITSIGGAEIRRDSSGKIKSVYANGESVKPLFSVEQ